MENQKTKRISWIFWIVYTAYMSIYIARVNLSMASPEMMQNGYLDSAQIGMMGSFFFVIYAVGRMINGVLSDVVPPRRMFLIGLGMVGISNLLISIFPPFIGILLLWVVNAYAQSMLWSSVLCVVTALYGKETSKRKSALMVTSVATGNILGIVANTWFITRFGVRFAFVVPGVMTMLLSGLTYLATRTIEVAQQEKAVRVSPLHLLQNKELLKMYAVAMMHGVMKENVTLWMAVYIVARYAVDLTTSSYYILLIPLIGLAGRVLYPMLLRAFSEKENKISLLSFVLCGVSVALLCTDRCGMLVSVLALGLIYLAVSMVNTSLLSIYPLRFMKEGHTASVGGMMDFFTYLGAGISSMIYGVTIHHFGYIPMFVSWLVLSLLSIWILYRGQKG